jgi:hypothetical protein
MTILEFARTVIELTGSASEIIFVTPQYARSKDDPQTPARITRPASCWAGPGDAAGVAGGHHRVFATAP